MSRVSGGAGRAPFEQVPGSRVEACGAELFEVECIAQPVGRVENRADGQRVLDLLTCDSCGQHVPHVRDAFPVWVGFPRIRGVARSPPLDRGGVYVGEHGINLRLVLSRTSAGPPANAARMVCRTADLIR
ncbi:hypothetical protein DMB37_28550 [Nocardia sp. CS682]|nr:hypothetical protein DMB37_28550 [Nocardia sp. CS682]